jgi:hypothetical protein
MALPRHAELTYLLGLCTHERAERVQARLDLLARTPGAAPPSPAEVDKAQVAWRDALGWWKEYLDRYPTGSGASAARRMGGRAQAILGDSKAAAALCRQLSEDMTALEKVAALYRARQYEK